MIGNIVGTIGMVATPEFQGNSEVSTAHSPIGNLGVLSVYDGEIVHTASMVATPEFQVNSEVSTAHSFVEWVFNDLATYNGNVMYTDSMVAAPEFIGG